MLRFFKNIVQFVRDVIDEVRKKRAADKEKLESESKAAQAIIEAEQAKIDYKNALINDFENKFGTMVSKQHQVMMKTSPTNIDQTQRLKETLVEGKNHVNNVINIFSRSNIKIPFSYEPDICDTHNESNSDSDEPDLTTLKKMQEVYTVELLKRINNGIQKGEDRKR